MSNVSSNTYTYTRVGAILHEIGMVTEEKMRSVLEEAATYADEEIDQYEAASALEEFGVAVSVHADDIDSIHYYADLMEPPPRPPAAGSPSPMCGSSKARATSKAAGWTP